jgi:CheY-like chemotaxis protein
MTAAQTLEREPKSKTTVIVVEPDIMTRVAIADYLRECGYRVIGLRSAQEAFTVLESGRSVDIVFAEVNLPEANSGFELARRIRSDYPGISVILTSGAEGAAEKAGDLCDEGLIQKPYSPQDIVRRIKLLHESKRTSKGD